MPRYFFHFTNGEDTLTDTQGFDFANLGAALNFATTHPYEILRRHNPIVWITDSVGVLIDAVSLDAFLAGHAREGAASEGRVSRVKQWQEWFGKIEDIVAAGYFELETQSGEFSCSAGFRRVMGLPSTGSIPLEQFLGRFEGAERDRLADWLRSELRQGDRVDLELRTVSHAVGSPLVRVFGFSDHTRLGGRWIMGVAADASERRTLEDQVWFASHHDLLTGLPNRTWFLERLDSALREASKKRRRAGLLVMDLHRLRDINARLGTGQGDAVLRAFAHQLATFAGSSDLVGRIGDDEFGMIIPDLERPADAEGIAQGLVAQLSNGPGGKAIPCSVSVGLAIFPDDGATVPELIEDAELALARAKVSRRDRVVPFLQDMRRTWHRRVQVVEQVKSALTEDRVFPFYQPKVSLLTGRTVGFEALLRWRHPARGVMLPGTIIEAFDDREVAEALSTRMQERVFSDIRQWTESGVDFGRIAINASPIELREEGYATSILRRLERMGVTPDRLEIEVTENAFIGEDSKLVAQQLWALRDAGITVALDDFGTGYGSLVHLRQFPVNVVKVDRSFTMDLGPSPNAALIVHAIVKLAASLGIEVVAEGVETPAQARFLAEEGCRIAQGFLFSKPLPAPEVPAAAKRIWPLPSVPALGQGAE